DQKAASQLAAVLIGFVALALTFERLARGDARFHETGRRDRRPHRITLGGWKSVGAIVACAAPPLFGFLVPASVLLELLLESGGPQRYFSSHLLNSLTLAGLASVIVTAVALLLAYAQKERPKALSGRAAAFASLGYAVPGSVIAVGVLGAFVFLDEAGGFVARSLFGIASGLLLTGGLAALLSAYLVRYLAVAL